MFKKKEEKTGQYWGPEVLYSNSYCSNVGKASRYFLNYSLFNTRYILTQIRGSFRKYRISIHIILHSDRRKIEEGTMYQYKRQNMGFLGISYLNVNIDAIMS